MLSHFRIRNVCSEKIHTQIVFLQWIINTVTTLTVCGEPIVKTLRTFYMMRRVWASLRLRNLKNNPLDRSIRYSIQKSWAHNSQGEVEVDRYYILRKGNDIAREAYEWKPQGRDREGIPRDTWRRSDNRRLHLAAGQSDRLDSEVFIIRKMCSFYNWVLEKSKHSLNVYLLHNICISFYCSDVQMRGKTAQQVTLKCFLQCLKYS